MKKLLLLFVITLTYIGVSGQATDLFFSEYIEGGSQNKALEIFNGTGSSIELNDYVIRMNYNGNSWNDVFTFPEGTILENNAVYVIGHAEADAAVLAVTDSAVVNPYSGGTSYIVSFNGDDVRALCKVSGNDTTIIDIIGLYNLEDPGSGWDVAGVTDATKDHTLVRKSSVDEGNTDWTVSAGTTTENSEWEVYEKDEFSYLGSHTMGVETSTETDILTFTFPEQSGGATISTDNHTVDIEVVYGTNVTALVPTITLSEGATVNPASGVANDFTNAVVYTVTAEDNTTTQAWTVTVTVGSELSHEAEMLTFVLADQVQDAVINSDDTTVTSVVAWDTDITSLSPTITVSSGAQVSQTVNVDFTNPVTIKVQAQDKVTIKNWVVTVTKAAEPNHDAEILTFDLDELVSDVVINSAAATITGQLWAGADTSALKPTITVSNGATIDPESETTQDFTTDVVYTVTAEDGTITKAWTVSLTVNPVEMVSIYDIQYTTDESGDSDYFGRLVKAKGIITGFDGYGFYMQDSAKAWNGIYIFAPDFISALNVGDEVVVEGSVNEYYGLTQLKDVVSVNVGNTGNDIPNAILLTVPEIQEPYESVIIKTEDLTCVSTDLYYDAWRVANGTDSLYIGTELFSYTPELADVFNSISGINTYKRSYFRILPRSADDIDKFVGVEENSLSNVNIFPNPVNDNLTINNLGSTSQIVISNVLGQTVMSVVVSNSTMNISFDSLEKGIYLITIVDSNNNTRTERVVKR